MNSEKQCTDLNASYYSRPQANVALTSALEDVLESRDNKAWLKLFPLLGHCCAKPKRGGKKSKSFASVVNRQIQTFTTGDVVPADNSDINSSKGKLPTIAKQLAMKLSVADIRGAVRVTSSKDKVLPANADTIAKLKEKHPSPHQGSILPPPPEGEDCLVVT